jgi:hypothetical protein
LGGPGVGEKIILEDVTDFRLSLWLIIGVRSVLGLLHRVDVDDVPHVSLIHGASSIIVEVLKWRQHILPKRREHRLHPHGVTTRKQDQHLRGSSVM